MSDLQCTECKCSLFTVEEVFNMRDDTTTYYIYCCNCKKLIKSIEE